MTLLFLLSVCAAIYSYFFYPLILLLFPKKRSGYAYQLLNIKKIAVIIAVRNEAAKIAHKIENTLALEFRDFDVEVIVASDASDDATDSIALTYASRGVRIVRSTSRKGKEHAQGLAAASTDADVLVFTDAGTILPPDALLHVRNAFNDPTVGAISSVDRLISPDGVIRGEGAYIQYEMWLRDLESNFFSLVGLSGSLFAARRTVCENWDDRVQSDFGTALNCVKLGYRAISDRNLVGYYNDLRDTRKEYQRKVRTITRGINSLRIRADVLNFFRYGRFSFEVFSHKVMRWLTPWFLLMALSFNVTLVTLNRLWAFPLVVQFLVYLAPLLTMLVPKFRKLSIARIVVYFVEVNLAIVHATLSSLRGKSILTWEPSQR